jgi:uncharacterized RDD family membrane protein YckC
MSQNFHIIENGQPTGPYTIDELRKKNIQKNTLVWTEGFNDWTKAEHVPLLKDILHATPPPYTKAENTTNSHQSNPNLPPTPPDSVNNNFGYELAKRRERFFATIIEAIIITIPLFIFFGDSIDGDDPFSFGSIIAGGILSAILGALFYPKWGGNLGHRIMGLQVISVDNGEVIRNSKTGAIRESLKSVLSVFIIPVIWLLFDSKKQNIYDKLVRTYVVKKK